MNISVSYLEIVIAVGVVTNTLIQAYWLSLYIRKEKNGTVSTN